ncbi:hepatitis A virus cellular receptor 1 isoform X1 [Saccopteryx leptura]|uniref:hepatitis A virus cellular receptor 1 isoform X1 n=1 Tax=Saccopteryx leptura TaxID=249018 RepID=UPI00339CEA3E
MCWGRGPCPAFKCPNELIWTDGYRVTFQKNTRYQLYGIIKQGNVSLTIEHAAPSDRGMYCCRVERSGWFNDLKTNILLDIKPALPQVTSVPTSTRVFTSAPTTPAPTPNLKTALPQVTSVPTSTRVFTSAPTTPAPTPNLKTALPQVTSVPTSTRVFTSAPTTPAPTPNLKTDLPNVTRVTTSARVFTSAPTIQASTSNLKTDGNSTVTQPSDGHRRINETHASVNQNSRLSTKEALGIGFSVAALMLLTVLAAVITRKYLCRSRRLLHISKLLPNGPSDGTLQGAAAVHYQADENVYFENNLYSMK